VTSKAIEYQTQDSCTIHGVLFVPDKPNGTAVLCLHQLQLDHTSFEQFATELADRGFYVLTPDLRGHGQSTSIDGHTLTHESMTEDEFRKIPGLDVEAAKAYLTSQCKIDPENIGIIGASIGANSALISAGRNPQTKFVVALSPGIDYRGIQPSNEVSQIQKPVLIIASQEDTYSAASSSELFSKIPASNKQIQIVEVHAHGTNMFQDVELKKFVLDWISEVAR
jgi:dienelactone hydrolase